MDSQRPFTVAVASGKGGTGKTFIATDLAFALADDGVRATLVDCDVDAPNDRVFFALAEEARRRVETPVASVDASACEACGRCSAICAFGAVRVLGRMAVVFDELCRGCGLCARVCPTGAIGEELREVGDVRSGTVEDRRGLGLVSGVLDVGQVKAPPVIEAAVSEGLRSGADIMVLDASPGVACSVVAALHHADALLLVTEPTPFGLHDLELALELGSKMGLPMAVVANRVTTDASAVEALAARWETPVIAEIPFSRKIAEIHAEGGLAAARYPGSSAWTGPIRRWIDERRRETGAAMPAAAGASVR